ncbi:LuxR C-terminal-related transcriptional regulator [Marinobacterium sediminicola]|uniref:Regulatory protein, luxR family n=1 Tax=Marinobacterium sediminicola TaxID=518898 RepID=A0ABY1S2K0_9GAMM|nr:LuxR C-terminal-related transcriptional regulator [Marinobacterium sediminicola]ULG68466.1 LuxR C-terminal-related transcriptional regulator [Marinobacterium sediminicola]SMR76774.1 regulatory protein, luxR family [Marinobacterium sediminicola]
MPDPLPATDTACNLTPGWIPSGDILNVLEQLGTTGFYDAFLDWLQREFGTEQCMVFYCADGKQVSTLIYKDYAREASGKRLAEAYVSDRHYLQDPNFKTLKTIMSGAVEVVRFNSVSGDMGLHYRKAFFETPGFSDKISIIRGTDQGNYYINLYRRDPGFDARFDSKDFSQSVCALISILISKHFELNERLRLEGPLAFLSEREQQVCRAVLRGKKNEAIAAELDVAVSSVITYRKRAYEKLGISSRAQLFALCQ